ncbi:hypothetical protein MRX96_012168 [Rhipicephalus microplus]
MAPLHIRSAQNAAAAATVPRAQPISDRRPRNALDAGVNGLKQRPRVEREPAASSEMTREGDAAALCIAEQTSSQPVGAWRVRAPPCFSREKGAVNKTTPSSEESVPLGPGALGPPRAIRERRCL